MTFNSIRWNWSDIFILFLCERSLWKFLKEENVKKNKKIFDFSFLYVIRAICFARSYFAWYYIFKILFFSIYDIIILWTNQMPLLRYLAILVLLFEFSVYFIFIDLYNFCVFPFWNLLDFDHFNLSLFNFVSFYFCAIFEKKMLRVRECLKKMFLSLWTLFCPRDSFYVSLWSEFVGKLFTF